MQLFHATSWQAAQSIDSSRRMRPGTHGYAGGAIYFSSTVQAACRKYHHGVGTPDIILCCKVQLGRVLYADKGTMNREKCWDMGYDSVKVNGFDVYAVYSSNRVVVEKLKRFSGSSWFSSLSVMLQQEAGQQQQQQYELRLQQQQRQQLQQQHELRLQQQQRQQLQQQHELRLQQQRQQELLRQRQLQQQQSAPQECLPGDASVMLLDGRVAAVATLKVGDLVETLTKDGSIVHSEIYAFGHYEPKASATFLAIALESGNILHLTPSHLVLVRASRSSKSYFLQSSEVLPGSFLHASSALVEVVSVSMVEKEGLFSPITMHGTLLVDDTLTSCYSVLRNHSLFHFAMLPMRMLYKSGLRCVALLAQLYGGFNIPGANLYIDLFSYTASLVQMLRL